MCYSDNKWSPIQWTLNLYFLKIIILNRNVCIFQSLLGMTGPMNAAVIRGSNTSFICSANEPSSFRWLGNLLESKGTVVIHTGVKFARVYKSMYSYENGTSSSTLIIDSVNTSYAGTYICDVTHLTKNTSAELIVLGMYIIPWYIK